MLGSWVRDHDVLTNIHLVYVRIPGKGITLHRLLHGDDDNSIPLYMLILQLLYIYSNCIIDV
jgi:hypothetical protein